MSGSNNRRQPNSADRAPSEDGTSDHLRDLSKPALSRRLDELLATLGEDPNANSQRALLLDLQTHQVELEMQGRALREAQQALAISRDRYARLFDLAPVGYAVFGRRGRIRDINLTAARMLGRPRSQIVGTPIAGSLQGGDIRTFLNHVHQVLDGDTENETRSLVVHLRSGEGPRTLRLLSSRRESDSGPECFSALIDITAQEEAERRQRESDRLRRAILDALTAEVVVLDSHGRIIAVNHAWQRFTEENGASPELRDGVGLDYLSACRAAYGVDAEEAHRIADGIAAVNARRSPCYSQEYPCHALERERWFVLTAAPFDGDLAGTVIVHVDITECKQATRETRRARDALSQAARVNTVGVLIASLIHELTQPLGAAAFYAASATILLNQDATDHDKLSQVLSGIDEQVQRASSILKRLRAFLRGREIQMKTTPIDDIVNNAVLLVAWFAADKNVKLEFAQPAPGTLIAADSLRLEQVLVNLVCNSIQAIDDAGSARREVSISVDPGHREIEVTVRDTGPGVPPDARERLFDIVASTKESGLGMGLAINKNIVETHGGRLWADPDAGDGAVFRFTLPYAEPTQEPE